MADIFRESGCEDVASPGCAACLGGPLDTYGRMNEPKTCVRYDASMASLYYYFVLRIHSIYITFLNWG